MATIHNTGFPRIGAKRELKFALESFWRGDTPLQQLLDTAADIRRKNWRLQSELDLIPVGDFSLYDHVLDMSFTLGNIPARIKRGQNSIDQYFQLARGRSSINCPEKTQAGEMTKWFDTNYHYIVPELSEQTTFSLNTDKWLTEIKEARKLNVNIKPVLIGPLTYLWLGKAKDTCDKLQLLEKLIPAYIELLNTFKNNNIEWVQIDEPILVTELNAEWQQAFLQCYHQLKSSKINILLASYFGHLSTNLQLVFELPVAGIHIDTINEKGELRKILDWLPPHKILSLGIISGRNIWKSDLNHLLDWLEPIHNKIGDRLWLAPSCSLLHTPIDLEQEETLDPEIKNWLAFAQQKLNELKVLQTALNNGRTAVAEPLEQNRLAIESRNNSSKRNNITVKKALEAISPESHNRKSAFSNRIKTQQEKLNLPLFPTTTIGSFPQTDTIRNYRKNFKNNTISLVEYQKAIEQEICHAINVQEKLGLDVFVHGEAERNDMVEYFGEQLEGFIFTRFGWVQSYGSRCVKPPIIYGDIDRPKTMTTEWINYAQSLTNKPVKGMLTGPVTILNWSFVRDDQPRATTCNQLALAIRKEVLDLESRGTQIIQIDEAALREGLPLRKEEWTEYLSWAVGAFRLTANGVKDETQIHTHMCYSDFNEIIDAIAQMDADVITIETSRSDLELLNAFERFDYPNDIGPGVYDIHSPNIPDKNHIIDLIKSTAAKLPKERLWINPDCGLKTRQWDEVIPSLQVMVDAAKTLRSGQLA